MDQLSIAQKFAIWALPVLFAITLHEVAHGWVALRFGDKTAKMLGRLTLNPIKHIDPIGTIIVPGVLLLVSGFIFGWAKPVPVTYENLKNPKRDMALVALAGPIANLTMAILWAILAKIGTLTQGASPHMGVAFIYMGQAGIIINLVLGVLNLIPIPPLDGSRIVYSFLSGKTAWYYYRIEPYGFLILVLLLFSGILSKIIGPPIFYLFNLILMLAGLK